MAESALSTVSSTAAQSAINGDSFGETLKNQGINILIGAAGNLGAKAIGSAAHGSYAINENNQLIYIPPSIDKATQLTLHGILGCGMGAAANGSGGCASGAVSGIIGEEIGSYAYNNLGMNRNITIQLGGLGGGLSAIITGNAVGLDDSEVAQNIWSGSRIGGNAAENNAIHPGTIIGGLIGAGGAATAAYLDGEKDPKNLGKAALVGGLVGAAAGTIMSPVGVVRGIGIGSAIGAGGGAIEGYFVTKLTNPNASSGYIFRNMARSSVVGGVAGATVGGFSGAFAGAGTVGYAAETIAGMNGFASGLFANSLTQNLFNSAPQQNYPAPTLQQMQLLNPNYKPAPISMPQTPIIIPQNMWMPR